MQDLEIGRLVRALRRRRVWRQEDCAVRARVHRSTWSNLERGFVDRMSLATVRRCLAVLEVRIDLVPRWRGADIGRLLDEEHSLLAAAWKARLERWGWIVRVEVSYSRYGERGRIDLLAWYPPLRILLVVEVKTEIVDVQALLGALDAKVRLAPVVARQLGWQTAVAVPMLLVAEGSTNRDRVACTDLLFSRLGLRGRRGMSWLRSPGGGADGVLVFSELRGANGRSAKSVGAHRIRQRAGTGSAAAVRRGAAEPSGGT